MNTKKESVPAVETKGLTKLYGGKAAVKDLNLRVGEGQIYGFIGRNGAGKSTTLKMISGLASPTQGEVSLFGKPLSASAIHIHFVQYHSQNPASGLIQLLLDRLHEAITHRIILHHQHCAIAAFGRYCRINNTSQRRCINNYIIKRAPQSRQYGKESLTT